MRPGRSVTDQQTYDAVQAYVEQHGISPTLRELAKELGIVPSTVREHLLSLRKKGLVTFSDSQPRTIRVVGCPVQNPSSEAGAA